MDVLEAHGRLAARADRSILPFRAVIPCDSVPVDVWPAYATAHVKLSGRLDDCETEEDLDDAINHAQTLVSADIVSASEIQQETLRTIKDLVSWGEGQCSIPGHSAN
jgi:hypothetical protein